MKTSIHQQNICCLFALALYFYMRSDSTTLRHEVIVDANQVDIFNILHEMKTAATFYGLRMALVEKVSDEDFKDKRSTCHTAISKIPILSYYVHVSYYTCIVRSKTSHEEITMTSEIFGGLLTVYQRWTLEPIQINQSTNDALLNVNISHDEQTVIKDNTVTSSSVAAMKPRTLVREELVVTCPNFLKRYVTSFTHDKYQIFLTNLKGYFEKSLTAF